MSNHLGRRRALAVIDNLLSDETNLAKLRVNAQATFDQDPLLFFTKIAAPLIPKAMIEDDVGGKDEKARDLLEAVHRMSAQTGGGEVGLAS